eukprot:TRINITY_DN11290_c0_g1_i10.p2 TRINITY_DN11290_c0_g1~~TRINITY_DN11290_c0_g1_i10.p2  ORF type:complete len:271 (+),score=42.79 TRINITY_DN11290_c0_g1_i10:2341-3153(+)
MASLARRLVMANLGTAQQQTTALPKAPWWSWSKTSVELLKFYQTRILAQLTKAYSLDDIAIELPEDHHGHITTLSMPPVPAAAAAAAIADISKPKLLLLHGFGGGVGIWNMNIEALSSKYQVHAIDMPGFASSSRLQFPSDPEGAEARIVTAIDQWREAMGIDKFVIAGHSFGGYVAGAYTLRYPEHVQHLVLVDAWGVQPRPKDWSSNRPWWQVTVAKALGTMPPLAIMRSVLNPFGLNHHEDCLARSEDSSTPYSVITKFRSVHPLLS